MRSTVSIEVEAVRGSTRVKRLGHQGALAARITTDAAGDAIHLVGTAAGPICGDSMEIDVRVGPGATLRLRSVAAAVVLPAHPATGPGGAADVRIRLDVATDAQLDLELHPTIVCAGAELVQSVTADVHEGARLRLLEVLVSGRYAEPGGAWASQLDVHSDGAPVLRQLSTDRTSPARVLLCAVAVGLDETACTAALRHGPRAVGDVNCGAVTCRLASGGWTTTAWGPALPAARAALSGSPGPLPTAPPSAR